MTAQAVTLAYAPSLSRAEQKGVSECFFLEEKRVKKSAKTQIQMNLIVKSKTEFLFPVSNPENPNTKEEA